MGNHPRPAAWKALGSALAALEEPRRSAGAARAAGAMGIAHRGQRARPVRAALIGGVRNPRLGRHGRAMRRSENDARRARLALGAIERQFVFRHRAYLREGPATLAEIFVDRHDVLLHDLPRRPAKTACQFVFFTRRHSPRRRVSRDPAYLSGDVGMSTPPLMCLMGPDAFGITSKSKMSVGSHSVAQAFGISTTPEMWPCTGAVPRIA
jgi:hypothetical protein